ncbi:cytidine and deoxycytidylate deaminase zinc-binding region protein, putative [Heliomicrobium modesticaldum Ice1]|uniref:tRNA-specific adenosine deaminase n=2 Tax=Heliomicrobium modesticaldum TaxID=35701 RepID=B0TAT0_HELMI|nr:nucleoside deaminase [Heliomicrobium modesticaldum]ABZ83732.1 cytidine and deoxycytidylate deaminase zinc-binding region protein, putative [Heliomicrobium modesticaldum Ice1]
MALADDKFMGLALEEGRQAYAKGEVPIGCVIVKDGEVIGRGHNLRETEKNPVAHAEVLAIQDAANRIGGWRLAGATLYVTVEPCPMCAGAIVLARIPRVVFAVMDPKGGAAGTCFNILESPWTNHRVSVISGVREGEARELMQSFFQRLRRK